MLFKEIDIKCRNVILKGIRDAFKRSDRYNQALKGARTELPRYKQDGTRAKVNQVFFKCEHCLELHKRDNVQVDHIEPVIPINNKLVDFTIHQIFERIFKSTLQVLCTPCHKIKSKQENSDRAKFRRLSK